MLWMSVLHLSLLGSTQAGVMDYFTNKKTKTVSRYQQVNPENPSDYGVDVSTPIHSFENVSVIDVFYSFNYTVPPRVLF